MTRNLAVAVAAVARVEVEGVFERHVSEKVRDLTGSNSGGRWGAPATYSVLYLGRPRASVTVEAYRHLVDPYAADGMTGDLVAPRKVLRCDVSVSEILDLRSEMAQRQVGLSYEALSSLGEYSACRAVGRVAHQLGLHGVIAPAATGLGETLALFEQHLPASELPRLVSEERWDVLPADPRRLRVMRDSEGSA